MVRVRFAVVWLLVLLAGAVSGEAQGTRTSRGRWTPAQANEWYAKQPWTVGSNYLPADAINELEMWQKETFNASEIDKEMGWAEGLGMNTMRVFLHDLLWSQDAEGFRGRMDAFLTIAAKHHVRPVFVLFDSVWDPDPKLGPQHPPIPGVHNSGWVQSPGTKALVDAGEAPRLEAYVKGVVGAFAADDRVLAWDVWNEPDNLAEQYAGQPKNKVQLVNAMLPKVYAWARSVGPMQPLTSGVWHVVPGKWSVTEKIQLDESDVISFHNYGWPESFSAAVRMLRPFGRPVICTEYMARSVGSTFDTILPIAKAEHVAAINWGFVNGKSQTDLPWDSWQKPYVVSKPPVWFHDVLLPDGRPYREREAEVLRSLTGVRAGEAVQ